MRRTLWIFLLLSATPLLAQPAGVTVSLTATTGNPQVGNPIALTATVRTPGIAVAVPGQPMTKYDRNRLRYTFKAQRSWPCAATKTLGQNLVPNAGESTPVYTNHILTYTWTPAAADAGEYTFSVDVTYVTPPSRLGKSPTELRQRPESFGTATSSPMMRVKPAPGFSHNIRTTFSPESGTAVAPANVSLTVSVIYPPEGKWWRFAIAGAGAPQVKDRQSSSTTFTLNLNAGSYSIFPTVDKVNSASCVWEQTLTTHADPYYYVVKAQ